MTNLEWSGPPTAPNVPVGPYSEAVFTEPRPDCPNPHNWNTWDAQGTEIEVIELVAGLIRGLQPEVVLETGTSRGFMAEAIVKALVLNGHGGLWTFEPDSDIHHEAFRRIVPSNPATSGVTVLCINGPSMQGWTGDPIDFAWFDSLLELRHREFDYYYEWMHPNTVVGFHDTAPHFGDWPLDILEDDRLDVINLPTPRGVMLGRVRA